MAQRKPRQMPSDPMPDSADGAEGTEASDEEQVGIWRYPKLLQIMPRVSRVPLLVGEELVVREQSWHTSLQLVSYRATS